MQYLDVDESFSLDWKFRSIFLVFCDDKFEIYVLRILDGQKRLVKAAEGSYQSFGKYSFFDYDPLNYNWLTQYSGPSLRVKIGSVQLVTKIQRTSSIEFLGMPIDFDEAREFKQFLDQVVHGK